MGLAGSTTKYAELRERLRGANPYVIDTGLALLVVAFNLERIITADSTEGIHVSWLGYLIGVLIAVPLPWRRRAPFTVAILVGAASVAYGIGGDYPGFRFQFGALVAVYTIASQGKPWQLRLTVPISLIASAVANLPHSNGLIDMSVDALTFITAYALGSQARTNRVYARTLEERATELEQQRVLEAERAAEQERARIARDMHDILAHAVSLIVVQAEAGPVVVRSSPEKAEAAFDAIASSGRDAMAQLRRVLGTLKTEEDIGARTPQPTLASIPALLAGVREAGLTVEYSVLGKPLVLTTDAELAVYRMVQESLTNVMKHAQAGIARVVFEWCSDSLVVTVSDDGRGGVDGSSAGHGLIGVRERISACGGIASAGPGADGGFVVTARVPAQPRPERIPA